MRRNMQKREKKHPPNIINRNLKHDYQISMIFGKLIFDTTDY